MNIGTTIVSGSAATKVLSPWFPREADYAIFTIERIYTTDTTLTVDVYHKNTEETGKGTKITGVSWSSISTTPNLEEAKFTPESGFEGFKEMVRFGYEVAFAGEFVLYRMLMPTWYSRATA